jgi:hypothetical protein
MAINRYFWVYGSYGYIFPDRKVAAASVNDSISGTNTVNRHYWLATGGLEVSFPTVHGIVPLLRVGAGTIHHNYNSYDVSRGTTVPIISISDSSNIPTGTVGGGIRWYFGERHGIRIMGNGYFLGRGITHIVPSSALDGVSRVARKSGGTVTIGYFFQFGGLR